MGGQEERWNPEEACDDEERWNPEEADADTVAAVDQALKEIFGAQETPGQELDDAA